MRLYHWIWLAGLSVVLLALPAQAEGRRAPAQDSAVFNLGGFDVVIADTGDLQVGWNDSPTHVYVKVLDGGAVRVMYFDNLPAALFVLRELYGTPRIVQLYVADFPRSGQDSGRGGVLIDGLEAYYVWDHQRFCRGNLPLVLAFSDYHAAVNELLHREGELLSYDNLVAALYRWADNNSSRIYWRGWDRQRWNEQLWAQAWAERWVGWGWDYDHGWGCFSNRHNPGGHGHNWPGPGQHPGPGDGDGDGGNSGPPPGTDPGAEPDLHYQYQDGGAGTDEYTGGQDSGSGNDTNSHSNGQELIKPDTRELAPPATHDSNKQTPRVKDEAEKPSAGDEGTGEKESGDKGTGGKETGEKSTGDKSTGDKGKGDKNTDDKGTGGKGSGRVK